MKPFLRNQIVRATAFFVSFTALAFSAKSQTIETLCFFNGTNGADPHAALLQAADGYFYGTTTLGGINYSGTVFKITTNGILTTLFSFGGSNGISPAAGLAQMDDGSFIGSTVYGGANTNLDLGKVGYGTLFKITTNGTFSNLFSFSKTNGAYPAAALLRGSDGNFYGSTERGGVADEGTLFKFSTNGLLTTFFHFNGINGSYPVGSLVELDGQFYGTTSHGGRQSGGGAAAGTVFKVTTNGSLTTLAALVYTTGAIPRSGLVLSKEGNFFGTTTWGGSGAHGTVFRITTNGNMTTLVSFDFDNGSEPQGGIVGSDGCFYGTTLNGGLKSASPLIFGDGTVFKVTPEGTFTTLAYLDPTNNGGFLKSETIKGSDGNLYGTALLGGPNNKGSIYRLTFPQITSKLDTDKIVLSWPTNQIGFRLQSAETLTSSSTWIDSTITPVVKGGQFTITNSIPETGKQFYRLAK